MFLSCKNVGKGCAINTNVGLQIDGESPVFSIPFTMNIGNDIIVRIFFENPINEISGKYYLTFRYDDIYGNEYDLTALENEQKNDKKLEYNTKDYFVDDFATMMSEFANSILKKCCYSGLVHAHFNFNTFDIEVNGEDKGTRHGFLNDVK